MIIFEDIHSRMLQTDDGLWAMNQIESVLAKTSKTMESMLLGTINSEEMILVSQRTEAILEALADVKSADAFFKEEMDEIVAGIAEINPDLLF